MTAGQLSQLIISQFPYEPTSQQAELIGALSLFCSKSALSDSVFLLNGYAGTGKTSLCAALVRSLNMAGVGTVLLAPTGRAAKVFSRFANHPAYTIHRRIYASVGDGITSPLSLRPAENRSVNTVFIVDEASMIGDDSASGYLLEHLVHYVYSGINCRMILIGDTAQLPPVGCVESPAMNPDVLRSHGLRVTRAVMTATVRQAADSGILYNATLLRRMMKQVELPMPTLYASRFPDDITVVDSEELAESLASAFALYGLGETILVTQSNQRATQFNMAIRSTILDNEEELSRNDRLLVARNNYFWTRQLKGIEFLANGDAAEIERIYGTESRYGMRFADVALRLPDRDLTIDCKIILDTLVSDGPTVSAADMASLYQAVLDDCGSKTAAGQSPYFNALQVKYGYALTCHKAQGGQWDAVFVDLAFVHPDSIGLDFYRWLYTAITRATTRLYLLNPSIQVK